MYNLEKQHAKGKLHAIERLGLLLDEGSFFETYAGVQSDENLPYDGVITGFGTIHGKTVACYAQDFTVAGGTLGYYHGQKIAGLYEEAVNIRCPIIGICDSGGARIQEGVSALAGYGDVFMQNVRASGYVPQISIIAGPCAGGAVYSPGITDFIFMIDEIGLMFITGSKVVKAAMNTDITDNELGGAAIQSQKSGVAHFRCPDEKSCFGKVRELLEYIPYWRGEEKPSPHFHYSSRKLAGLRKVIPDNPKRGYDMRKIIKAITDDGDFFEVQEEFARNIVVGFSRLEGATLGIVASQPLHIGGIANSDASDKAARFIRFCDAFDIPLLTLVDIPGFVPGPEEERKGIIRHGAKLIYAYAEATVPKVTVILRKAYGGAYIAMCSRHLGADFVYAWPGAEIAVMGAEGAVQILHSRELAGGAAPGMAEALEKEYRGEYMTPNIAARKGYITDVIEPEATREKITRCFTLLREKKAAPPLPKKHGNIPL